jgi:DNA-binding PadR family transcriptional regulator
MIEQEFLLLGMLKESPKHGYEIKKKIKEILALFAGVDLKSIYYPLRVLEEKGLVDKRSDKFGRRPQRFVYRLTPKGEARLNELLSESFLNFKRPQFSLDLSLYFLHFIKPAIARRRLRARLLILKKLSRELGQMVNSSKRQGPASLACILEHNLKMLDAEAQFLINLIKSLR